MLLKKKISQKSIYRKVFHKKKNLLYQILFSPTIFTKLNFFSFLTKQTFFTNPPIQNLFFLHKITFYTKQNKLKLWKNLEPKLSQLKNSNCDNSKTQIVTYQKHKLWKFQIVRKLKNSSCDKTQNSYCDKIPNSCRDNSNSNQTLKLK